MRTYNPTRQMRTRSVVMERFCGRVKTSPFDAYAFPDRAPAVNGIVCKPHRNRGAAEQYTMSDVASVLTDDTFRKSLLAAAGLIGLTNWWRTHSEDLSISQYQQTVKPALVEIQSFVEASGRA